jgi:hypothetical protein
MSIFAFPYVAFTIYAFDCNMLLISLMERIDPQQDHERLKYYSPGQKVAFDGKAYTIQRRTTLASGEAAVVLQGEREQFVIGAREFLAGIKS